MSSSSSSRSSPSSSSSSSSSSSPPLPKTTHNAKYLNEFKEKQQRGGRGHHVLTNNMIDSLMKLSQDYQILREYKLKQFSAVNENTKSKSSSKSPSKQPSKS